MCWLTITLPYSADQISQTRAILCLQTICKFRSGFANFVSGLQMICKLRWPLLLPTFGEREKPLFSGGGSPPGHRELDIQDRRRPPDSAVRPSVVRGASWFLCAPGLEPTKSNDFFKTLAPFFGAFAGDLPTPHLSTHHLQSFRRKTR